MSTIGIQSTANQCQSNGLSSRVPYDVGRSISTCSSTPMIDTATSMPNDAFVFAASSAASVDRTMRQSEPTSDAATTMPSPTMPERSVRQAAMPSRYFTAPPAVVTMSMSGAFEARTARPWCRGRRAPAACARA